VSDYRANIAAVHLTELLGALAISTGDITHPLASVALVRDRALECLLYRTS
jgi:hypothetical protein